MPLLELRVCAARNLHNTQFFGKIDPYCTVSLENKQWRTKAAENTTNPEWNEVFKFNIADENSSRLHFVIWDKNTMSDDFLGEYYLSLSGLVRGEVLDKWVLLANCKGNAELHVRILAVDFGNLSPQDLTPPHPEYRPMPQGYAPPPQQNYGSPQGYPQQGYPPQQQQGYPPQQGGYPPQQGYPQQGGYPPQQGGYPPQQQQQYPPQQGYPQQGGYGGFGEQQQHHHHHHGGQQNQYQQGGQYHGLEQFFGRPIRLRTVHNTFIKAPPGEHTRIETTGEPREWETFYLEPRGNGSFIIRTFHGTYIRANPGGEGAQLDTARVPAEWETWWATPTSGHHTYNFRSVHGSHIRCCQGYCDLQPNPPQDWERIQILA